MLFFHQNASDSLGIEIKDLLDEHATAHKVVSTSETSYIRENDFEIKGREGILEYLNGYVSEQVLPHSISADSCRIDPKTGKTC